MEEWQCEGIKQNKVKLLRLTHCNELLLAILVANDILTYEEKDLIDSKATQALKADKLYEILPSRVNSFDILLKASRETNQSGLLMILEDAQLDHKLSAALDQCVKSDFIYQTMNPFFLSTNISFESLRRAIANFIDIEIFKIVFDIKKEMKPWLLRGPINETLLHISVAYGYISMIEYLISLGVDPNSMDGFGRTSNHYIGKFSKNVIATTKTLVCHEVTLDQIDKNGMTVATTVASHGTINQLHYHLWAEYMIKNKYDHAFNQTSEVGVTSLHQLMEKMDLEINTIEILLNSANININQPDSQGHTILHWALLFGRSLKLIKQLLDLGADYKHRSNTKEGVLQFAVKGGNKEVITFLISLKLDINEVDELGETPIHKVRFTKTRDYLGMTIFMLNHGADLNARDKNGDTIAHLFAYDKSISLSDFQNWVNGIINIGHGHSFSLRGSQGRTPLHFAMETLDLEMTTIKMILESSKVEIDQPDDYGDTLLQLALFYGRTLETMKNLIALGAKLDTINKSMDGVLHNAVIGGNPDIIQYLVSQGLDINERNNHGETPLHRVVKTKPMRYVELTKLLLDNGADLYSQNSDGDTLAHLMAFKEDVSCYDFKFWVTAMIENGHAHLFTIGDRKYGLTPLHSSMKIRDLDLETIKLIIESAKLEVNHPDNVGDTILHLALIFGRSLNTIKNLLLLGADWRRKGMKDRNVMHSAVIGSNDEAFLYFKSFGADFNATDKDGKTPLHYVALTKSKNYLGLTKFLLENGAYLNAKDNFGRTLDHLMSSYKSISDEEYCAWKEGMFQLGYAGYFWKAIQSNPSALL